MAPKKIAETAAETLTALLSADRTDFGDFLAQTGPGVLKLINRVLAPITDGQSLVTLTDHDGCTVGFALRPAHAVTLRGHGDNDYFLPTGPVGSLRDMSLDHILNDIEDEDEEIRRATRRIAEDIAIAAEFSSIGVSDSGSGNDTNSSSES